MGQISNKLHELGIELPPVAKPVAAYIPAQRTDNIVRTSGQLPLTAGQLPGTGKVGGEISPDDAYQYARTSALNALAAAASVAGGIDNIERILHATVFVSSTPDFTGQPQVANGASELFSLIFGDKGLHTRSAVGVAVLPLDAPVEVEIEVLVRD
ncbi:RidA family protein [Actinotignum urinale]|uniref:RidA family protein n=1 Tax=Actinotignum urinale TaxID=190146 RepID=A0AAW9HU66_9ACTO|nr:RidA family protein [Actinotignum urinale]MDY5129764.1 RidA family protein [Actinotignum urinale]MDY5133781.1 RidA family protein [Actinotignum urinale]MDY5151536.1 RidA family protein [Actinotignum urinale]MDY5155184.1 RidA family protein [Actinotignum urinale]